MNYTYPVEEYINQLKAYYELEAIKFSQEEKREDIIKKLEERSKKKKEIATIANTIIKEYIQTFEKNPELLTHEDSVLLEKFLDLLYPDGTLTINIEHTDYGVFFRIAKILANYYKKNNDINHYVFALNRCSLGFLLLIDGHCYSIQDSLYFDESLELINKLDSDELDEKSKMKVLVILTREAISSETSFPTEKYQTVYNILTSHLSEKPTAYEINNMIFYCTTILQLFREHNFYAKKHNISFDIESSRSFVYVLINYMTDIINKYPSVDDNGSIKIDINMTRFFLGDITIDEILSILDEQQKKAANAPNTIKQIQGIGMNNSFYLNILYRFSDKPKKEIIEISRERIKDVLPKLLNISRLDNYVLFDRYIVEFLYAASLSGSFDDFSQIILDSTVYEDKALFIHTALVKEMSCAIFDYMIETMPEYFSGVAGHDLDYISSHKDEMKQLLSDSCMFHDIGKFFMLDIVENSMRYLTDDEFGLIKMHPKNFENIYQAIDENDERVLCIRDCAITHHLWHDGTRGYPTVSHTKNRPFSDILAIADSIDAATDYLGRPYNSGKTIDQLIEEFQKEAGTHYSEDVVKVLAVKEVRDKLNYWITEGRKEIYYRVYTFNKI